MEEKIRELLDEYGGRDFVLKSYVSPQNTQIEAVQFVLQTAAVAAPAAPETAVVEEEESSILQRFLDLGSYLDQMEQWFHDGVSFFRGLATSLRPF